MSTWSRAKQKTGLYQVNNSKQGQFDMNKNKAMKKKAAAAGRADYTFKETIDSNGNSQYIFELNMGIFENIRHLLDQEFKMNPDVTKDFNGYKNHYNYTEIFRVKDNKGDPSYTVSLFLTTSRIQANGRTPQKFVDLLKDLSRRVNKKEAEYLNQMILQTKKEPVEEKREVATEILG